MKKEKWTKVETKVAAQFYNGHTMWDSKIQLHLAQY